MKSYFQHTDDIYFGAINLLQSTGNYGLANIIVFVILFPLSCWFLLVKSPAMQEEINFFKKQKMNLLIDLAKNLYAYCTGFIINLANPLRVSYYEVNFVLFCVLFSLILIASAVPYLVQKVRLKGLREKL